MWTQGPNGLPVSVPAESHGNNATELTILTIMAKIAL